ncbi:MAG TPA: ribosome maturation factor RimP [Burkholderiaceae bacterium]|nr:ribosome maturation factor RimP [Burkholderiaceae bacterium]
MTDLFTLTQEVLLGTEIELVDVERAPMGLLRVTIDKPAGVRIEDCEQVSRQLSRVFEVEGVDYRRLEVGSPGVNRPLKKADDFIRFADNRIELRLREPVDNRKVFVGVLKAPDDAVTADARQLTFALEIEAETKNAQTVEVLEFTFDDVERAKLHPVLDFRGKKR